MPHHGRAPAMVGRDAELARLVAVLDRAEDEIRTVLISGDAGIGKSRLVEAVVAAASAAGAATAVGQCVQLGETSLPLIAVVDALDQLRTQCDTEPDDAAFAVVDDLLRGSVDGARESGRLVERTFGLLVGLAATRPVVLVVEDVHWADATTRDLLAVIGRSRRRARLTVLVTYRDEEIHAGHPWRPTLRTLSSVPTAEHVRLAGLDRRAAAALVSAVGGADADARIGELVERTGGNPLHLEELADGAAGLPASLAELFLDRVADLAPATRTVLGAAAVAGDVLDEDLLAAVTGAGVAEVAAALREAVDRHVLVLDPTSCRFRHALVREALAGDLLPGERVRLHRGYAEALTGAPAVAAALAPGRWARIAHHWRGAHDDRQEIAARLEAAREATRVNAYGDAADHLERIRSLWDAVPGAADVLGLDLAEVLLLAAEAVQTHERSPRAVDLVTAALAHLGPSAPVARRVRALDLLGRAQWTLHNVPASDDAYRRAADAVATAAPSAAQAVAYASLGQSLMLRNQYTESLELLDHAIDVAQQIGHHEARAQSWCTRGASLVGLGRVDEGLRAMAQCLELAAAHGLVAVRARGYTNLLHCLYLGGRHAEVERVGPVALDFVVGAGHARHYGEAIAGNVIASLTSAGRLARAAAVHDDPRIPNGDAYQELRWFPVLLATGRFDEAERLSTVLLEETVDAVDAQFRAAALLGAARLALARARPADARDPVDEALTIVGRGEDQVYAAALVAVGLRAELDLLWSGTRPTADVRDACRRRAATLLGVVDGLAARDVALLPSTRGHAATSRALAASVCDDDGAAALWQHAVRVWDEVGQPLDRAAAQLALAQVLLRAGDAPAAHVQAQAALETALALGASPLVADVVALARRGRLKLSGAPTGDPEAEPVHRVMTGREGEVLRLVARGRTNRQIGEELFISEKTASVHVSNVMRKLGATNRAEAAAIAGRLGLVEPTGADPSPR